MYEVHEAPSKIAHNTVIQIIGRVLFLAFSLINFKVISVYLGPTLFGDYGNVFNYVALFTVLADFGLFTVAVREISKKPHRRQVILENVFTLRLVLALVSSVLAMGVAYLIAWLLPNSGYPHLIPALYIGVFNMVIFFMGYVVDAAFHVELKMYFISLVELIGKAVAVLGAILAIVLKAGFLWIVAAVAVGTLASFVARLIMVKPFFKLRLGFNYKLWRWLLAMAIPLGIVFALNNLYFKIDSIMLYLISGSYANGIYTAAYRVLETIVFVSVFFVAALTPYLSNYLDKKRNQARKLITVGFEIMLATGAIISIALIFYAQEVIVFLSGNAYLPAAVPLTFLAFVVTFLYINSLLGQVLVLLDRRRLLITVSSAILLLNVALNFYLIPKFTFVGAAASTLICETLLLGTNLIIIRYNDLLNFRKKKFAYLGLSLSLAIVLFAVAKSINLYWIIGFFGIPALYFVLLWRQGVIPLNYIRKQAAKTI